MGLAIVAFATVIVFYGRLIRTVELAATVAGFVDSDIPQDSRSYQA